MDEVSLTHVNDPNGRAARIGAKNAKVGAGGESCRLRGYGVFPDDAMSSADVATRRPTPLYTDERY
jgi:hypothetical protein